MEIKKKISIKKWIIIVLAVLLLLFLITMAINFYRVKQNKKPLFYFVKTINSLDGSIVYNIFPYKITDYKNSVNDDNYIEISLAFKPYDNQFYNPKSNKYVFISEEYKAPVFDLNKYKTVVKDVIEKVNNNGFKIGTSSEYSNIYIETGLLDENLNVFKEAIQDMIKEKYSNKQVIFTTLNKLKDDKICDNGKIYNGIYIKTVLLENKEKEDIMSLELVTNKTEIFSQKVYINNQDLKVRYIDDFDQIERIETEKARKEELLRKQEEERKEKERIEKERAEKERLERELRNKLEEYSKREERLKLLLSKNNLFVLDEKKAFIEAKTIETIKNKELDLNNIKSYDFVKINVDKIMYHYQEQIIGDNSLLVYIKEKQLTDAEYIGVMKNLEGLTGYSGVGTYQGSNVLRIDYLNKNKNVLLTDIVELFKKINFNIES